MSMAVPHSAKARSDVWNFNDEINLSKLTSGTGG